MAKYKRTVIGSIIKNKDSKKGDYLKVNGAHVLTDGQYLNLESKASQLASLDEAIAAGKISGDNANAAKERINKIPDFVRFQVVAVSKE
jgi:hypothetical protein